MQQDLQQQLKSLKTAYDATLSKEEEVRHAHTRFLRKLERYEATAGVKPTARAPFVLALRVAGMTARSTGAVLAVVLFVFGIGAVTVAALPGMLPGDALYGVKLATERAQVSLAFQSQDKARLELEFASRRMEETATLAEGSLPDRDLRMLAAVGQFRQHISNTNVTLAGLQQNGEAISVAKTLDRKASDYDAVLERAAGQVSGAVKEEVRAAQDEVQEASFSAVAVLLERQEAGELSTEELAVTVQEKLRELEASIQAVAHRVAQLPAGPYPEIQAIGGPTLQALYFEVHEARSALETGKDFFAHGGYAAALKHYRAGVGELNTLQWGVGLYEQVLVNRTTEALELETEVSEEEAVEESL